MENILYAVPLDFEQPKSDSEYRYSLVHLRNIADWYKEMSDINIRSKAINLLQLIEQELR